MENNSDILMLHKNRENMYRLLSRLYLLEVDDDLLNTLKQAQFPCSELQPELDKGFKTIKKYMDGASNDVIDELAVDYASTFLSAGIADGKAAFPYESIYISSKGQTNSKKQNSVTDYYYRNGLKSSDQPYKIPEDHIGLELAFIARLCEKLQNSDLDENTLRECIEEQKSFLKNHLDNWVYYFCKDIDVHAKTDFYKGVAQITKGFLKLDMKILNDIDKQKWGLYES